MSLSPMDAREPLGWAGAWMSLSSGGAFQTQESPRGRAGAWVNLSPGRMPDGACSMGLTLMGASAPGACAACNEVPAPSGCSGLL